MDSMYLISLNISFKNEKHWAISEVLWPNRHTDISESSCNLHLVSSILQLLSCKLNLSSFVWQFSTFFWQKKVTNRQTNIHKVTFHFLICLLQLKRCKPTDSVYGIFLWGQVFWEIFTFVCNMEVRLVSYLKGFPNLTLSTQPNPVLSWFLLLRSSNIHVY